MPRDTDSKSAQLYRMVMPGHVCPYGLKSKDLLERHGFEVEDHTLQTREDTDAFMEKHGVETTPQTFIGGERIGGSSTSTRPRKVSVRCRVPAADSVHGREWAS